MAREHHVGVAFAFVVGASVVFAYMGTELGVRLADAYYPDARAFEMKGGSIETRRLTAYHEVPWQGFLLGGVLGILVGAGFYAAWRQGGRPGGGG